MVCTPCPESLLNQLSCCRYLGPDYGDLQRPAGEVALADLPRLAHESFPLCMLVSHTVRQVKLHILSACKANSMTQTSSLCGSLLCVVMMLRGKLQNSNLIIQFFSMYFHVPLSNASAKSLQNQVSQFEHLQTCTWQMIRPSDPVSTNSMHSSLKHQLAMYSSLGAERPNISSDE